MARTRKIVQSLPTRRHENRIRQQEFRRKMQEERGYLAYVSPLDREADRKAACAEVQRWLARKGGRTDV